MQRDDSKIDDQVSKPASTFLRNNSCNSKQNLKISVSDETKNNIKISDL